MKTQLSQLQPELIRKMLNIVTLRNIRSVSSLLFQVLSPEAFSYVPLRVSSPSPLLWLRCIFSSRPNPSTPIDVYRHLYKPVGDIHLLKSIGEKENDGNHRILKGVARFGDTQ